MKLIIQIPCFNEEESLPGTLADLPKSIAGFDEVEWLIIDDGSTDRTVQVAKELGVHHIVSFHKNQGLAKGFMAGIEACLKQGADVIVNTDADNQYCAADIPKLVDPILKKESDMVIGERPISNISHFSPVKKILQKLGSFVVRKLSRTNIIDAPSGFRAISKQAAMQLNVFNEYTYTLETIIQAGHKGIAITSVPVRVNGKTRPSKLVKNIFSYVQKSVFTMLRIFITYRPIFFFSSIGSISTLLGVILGTRFLIYYFMGHGNGMIQSLILSALLIGVGFFLITIAFIADIISVNRKLLENLQLRLARMEEQISKNV